MSNHDKQEEEEEEAEVEVEEEDEDEDEDEEEEEEGALTLDERVERRAFHCTGTHDINLIHTFGLTRDKSRGGRLGHGIYVARCPSKANKCVLCVFALCVCSVWLWEHVCTNLCVCATIATCGCQNARHMSLPPLIRTLTPPIFFLPCTPLPLTTATTTTTTTTTITNTCPPPAHHQLLPL